MERIVWRFIPGYPAVFHQIRLPLTVVQRSIVFPVFRIISNIIERCLQLQIPCIGIVSSEKIAVSVTHIIAIPIINGISFDIGLIGTLVINRQPIFIQNRIDMGLQQTSVYNMDQGYISVRPTVRIRREALQGGRTALVLCFKGAGTLSREEIETEIDAELFAKLEHLIGKPLIRKERRGYRLPGGLTLEVNCVDPDLPTAFWYAEVEFETEAQALAWDPAAAGLADYLHDECTGKPGSSMGEYWLQTRK